MQELCDVQQDATVELPCGALMRWEQRAKPADGQGSKCRGVCLLQLPRLTLTLSSRLNLPSCLSAESCLRAVCCVVRASRLVQH